MKIKTACDFLIARALVLALRADSRTRFARVLVDFRKVKESNVCVQANHAGVLFCEFESKSSVEKLS